MPKYNVHVDNIKGSTVLCVPIHERRIRRVLSFYIADSQTNVRE